MTAAAIQGRLGELWVSAGSASTITKQACEVDSGTTYHVTDAAKRYLDPNTAVLVYDNDVLQTSGYRLKGGCQIVFDSAPVAPVTVSGKYFTPAEVTLVQKWSLSIESEVYKITSLGDTSQKFVGSGIIDWSGSFERFYEDNTWQAKAVANATLIIVRLFEDQPAGRVWTGWASPNNWNQDVSAGALQTEGFSFVGFGEPAYTTDES